MAIFLGSSNFSGYNGSHFTASVYLDSYSQDINANRTDYTLHLYAGSIDGYSGSGSAAQGYIQGVNTGSTTRFPARTQVDMGTYSGSITHNNDGTAWLGVSASVVTNWSGVGSASISAGWTPPTIPRSASVTGTSSEIGAKTTITIARLTTNFKYNLRYSIKDDAGTEHTGTIATGINQDSYEWTVPEIFYQYWTKGAKKFCTIYCDTYNGNSLIGTKSTNIQILINTNTKPDITNYNFRDMNSKTVALTDDNGKMVQGYSVGHLSFTATLNYYSKVDKVVDGDGNPVDYEIVSNTEQKQVISIEKDYTDFSVGHMIWVWDGRGVVGRIGLRTQNMATFPPAVKTIVYERVDYIPLTLSMTAKRPSATTGEIAVAFSGNYFNADFGAVDNTLELSWKYRQKDTTTWTNGGTFVKNTDYEITGNVYESKGNVSLGNIFDYRNIYEIAIYYKDKLVDTYTTKTVTRGLPIFWWNKDGVYDGNNKKFLTESVINSTFKESENEVYSTNYINNLASPKYLLAKISTNGYISHTGFSDFVLTEIENNTDNKLVIKNNKIVVKENIKHIRVSGTIFCEGLENNAYIWGILNKGTTAFTSVINSGSYFQSVVFPDKIISVTTNDTISGKIQASGTSNVSVRTDVSTAWLLVEILD